MKVLVIIISRGMYKKNVNNIKKLKDSFDKNIQVDYCCISGENDFNNYENVIKLKYKIISKSKQLEKMCEFITDYKDELDYDWFIKFRPELVLNEPIDFSQLKSSSINARVREYKGPLKIKYGCIAFPDSERVGGNPNSMINHTTYSKTTERVVLEDMIYIFDRNVIKSNGFDKITKSNTKNVFYTMPKIYGGGTDNFYGRNTYSQNEWMCTALFKYRNINLNIIGINVDLPERRQTTQHINM